MSPPDVPPAEPSSEVLPPQRARIPAGAAPVLHLDTPFVELAWVRDGCVQHLSLQVEGSSNELLVEAARNLLKRARVKRRAVILCLSAQFFDSRQVLLGKIPEDEAFAVIARKAANGLGVDLAESLFWARRCEAPLPSAEAAQSTWLVHTRRRSEHYDLLMRLRQAGVRVRRTVAGRDVLTQVLPDVDSASGSILVSSTGRAVYAHLFRGSELVQESRLPLPDFDERGDTYANIVQDVRQLAAFWSKGSRGAPLEAVHLFGFSGVEVAQMRTPLGIAAQGAELRLLACPDTASYADVRTALLEVFMLNAQRAPDLSIPLPPRSSRVVAATVLISLLAGVGAWKVLEHWSRRIDARTAEIRAELSGTESVEADGEMRDDFLRARARLLTSIESLEHLPERGVPLDEVLSHVHEALGTVVDVRHLSVEENDDGPRVVLEASLADEVGSAARTLEGLRRRLEHDPRFGAIEIQPSSHVPDRDRGEVLTFTFAAFYLGSDA